MATAVTKEPGSLERVYVLGKLAEQIVYMSTSNSNK